MRALVLGARGFVGTAVVDALVARGYEVVGSARSAEAHPAGVEIVPIDLRDQRATREAVAALDPDVIVHLASQPHVAEAELPEERAVAARVATTTRTIAAHCTSSNAHLVLLSSDYVFDGTSGPYAEEARPKPINAYGRAKLALEEAAGLAARSLLVRTSLVYGWPRAGQHPNFVSTLIEAGRRGETTVAFRDVVRTPIYVRHLADTIAGLVVSGATGLYHAGSANAVSMLDLSVQVCDLFGLSRGLVAEAAAGDADPLRPLKCGLEATKAAAQLSRPPATTEEGLSSMKEEEPAYV